MLPEVIKDILHSVKKPYHLQNKSFVSKRKRDNEVKFWSKCSFALAPKIWKVIILNFKTM